MDRDTYTNEGYLRIGDAARRIGVSVDTLRRWDRTGVLVPLQRRRGQRVYGVAQIVEFIEGLAS